MKKHKQMTAYLSLVISGLVFSGSGHTAPINFLAAGANPGAIQTTVDNFRTGLGGGLNGNLPVNFADGRRQIDWDGVPDAVSDPNAFPGDFFNGDVAGRARGVEFIPAGTTTGFQVSTSSASGVPVVFGSPADFQVFSAEKLFRTVGGNEFDILPFSPSDQITPALTNGFGMVFTDADSGILPILDFFSSSGALLHSVTGQPTGNFGLGFVGTVFDTSEVARIHVTIGGAADLDGVVMDDFIFGEPLPAAIPEPGTLALMVAGAFYFIRRGSLRRATTHVRSS